MGKHEKKSKKHKEKKSKHKHKRKHKSSSSSSSTEDEWVEKRTQFEVKRENEIPEKETAEKTESRDGWMNLTTLVTYSHKDRRKEEDEAKQKNKILNQYDPKKNVRELNPYWKDGGDGLPSAQSTKFLKPSDDDRYSKNGSGEKSVHFRKKSPQREDRRSSDRRHQQSSSTSYSSSNSYYSSSKSNWRKKSPHKEERSYDRKKEQMPSTKSSSEIIYESEEVFSAPKIDEKSEIVVDTPEFLTDKEMNDIAAKILKAEILGNTEKVTELKNKLECARELRYMNLKPPENEEVILTRTDQKGFSIPIDAPKPDTYNEKRKKQVVGTHDSGKRTKYYPDDDKYSLKNMFENERFSTSDQQNEEFMKVVSKVSKSDNLDDLFVDNIRMKETEESLNRKEKDRAIREHQKISQSLDNCQHCIQSSSMLKHLMVSLDETVYLSLPQYEPLTDGHCLIIPVRHVPCSTQLDENEWSKILDFRKALTNMFKSENRSVLFYETAVNLHTFPHMVIHCVPVPEEDGDMAPIYFKKAIDECETEWSTNKKLVSLAGKDVRRAVPKGLPYFCVSFGMTEGFAHVIEEQKYFPKFFAEEIIGGILDLHHSKWRKAFAQKFDVQKARVVEFSNNWANYDCSNKQ